MSELRHAMQPDEAHATWDVLVRLAGAREHDRDAFVEYLTEHNTFGHEYRFIGLLGFGGKLHYGAVSGAYVGCYPEDRDQVRDAIVAAVNDELGRVVPGRRFPRFKEAKS